MKIIDEAFAGMPVSVPVIDAHSHILGYYRYGWYQAFTGNSDVIALMDHLGIDCIVTAPHTLILDNMEQANKVAVEATQEYHGRIYGYISINPVEGLEAVKFNLKHFSNNKNFIGLKFLPGYHGPLACAEYDYAMDFAEEMACPVLCHIWGNNPPLKDIERAVKARPELKLMIAHQGGGTAECTDEYAKLMGTYPNLYMEICGSLYNSYSIEELVAFAGEDRVIFGSDQINLDPRYDFGRVVFSTLDDRVKKKILAENFINICRDSRMGHVQLLK